MVWVVVMDMAEYSRKKGLNVWNGCRVQEDYRNEALGHAKELG